MIKWVGLAFIFLSLPAFANWYDQVICRGVFTGKLNRLPETKLLERPQDILKLKEQLKKANSSSNVRYSINAHGDLKYSYKKDQIRPDTQEGLIDINVYSRPYLNKNNEYIVDINMSRKLSGEYIKDQSYLSSIPLDDFYLKVKSSYFKSQVYIGRYGYFSPAKTTRGNKYVSGKILDIKDDHVLLLYKGKQIRVTKEKYFFENYFIPIEEVRVYNKFFATGGKGQLFINRDLSSVEGRYNGYFLEITALPKYADDAIKNNIILDQETYRLMDNLLKENKHTLIFVSNERGVNGFRVPSHHRLAQNSRRTVLGKKQMIAMTPMADAGIVSHELRHANDEIEGIVKTLKKRLTTLQVDSNLTDREIMVMYKLVLEQRAYAKQYEAILEMQSKGMPQFEYSITGPEKISYEQYFKKIEKKHIQLFERRYLERVRTILSRTDLPTKVKSQYQLIIKDLSYPSAHPTLNVNIYEK